MTYLSYPLSFSQIFVELFLTALCPSYNKGLTSVLSLAMTSIVATGAQIADASAREYLRMQTRTCIFVIFNYLKRLKYIITYHYCLLSVTASTIVITIDSVVNVRKKTSNTTTN